MFCFKIKEKCKEQECVGWKNEECMLTKFLELSIEDLEIKLSLTKVPEELKNTTTEDLYTELIEYAKSKDYTTTHDIIEEFWLSKGIISTQSLPIDIQKKISTIRTKVSDTLEKELKNRAIPEYVKITSEEEIATNLIEYAKSKDYTKESLYNITEAFWLSKGITHTYSLPADIQKKISSAKAKVTDILTKELQEKDIPEYIKITPAEDIATELSEYLKNVGSYNVGHPETQKFWLSKGISSTYSLPTYIQTKIEAAKKLVDSTLKTAKEDRLTKEKLEIDNLADACVEWARSQGINTVITKPTLEAFLQNKSINILYETRHMLYNLANTKSKQKR